MKKSTIITAAVISIIAFTAFSFSNKEHNYSQNNESLCEKPDTSKKKVELDLSGINPQQFEQRLFFNIRGRYNGTTTKSRLFGSEIFNDFISGYPSALVFDYISVEMTFEKDDSVFITSSSNDTLTQEQRGLINSLDINDNLTIKVQYNSLNAVTNELERRHMDDISLIVVPEFEALPVYGYEILIQYLEENSFNKIPIPVQNEVERLVIHFTINEKGEINNVILNQSSGNTEVDELILNLTNNMLNWTPAEDNKGITVSQDFELSLGNWQNGC